MDADLESIEWMSGALTRFAVQSDQRAKPFRLAADDGDHQRQSEHAGSNERCWSPAHAQPDRQRILQRSWIYSLTRQRWPEPAGPRDLLVVTNLQQQIELLGDELVVVVEPEPEQRECLDRRPASDDHLGASLRDEIEGREFLKYAHGIRRAQHRHRARQPDATRSRGGCGEYHRWRGIEEFLAMVLADSEDVETD